MHKHNIKWFVCVQILKNGSKTMPLGITTVAVQKHRSIFVLLNKTTEDVNIKV